MSKASPPKTPHGVVHPQLGVPTSPLPQLWRCRGLARPRLTLPEPSGTVQGSFNLMKCEAFLWAFNYVVIINIIGRQVPVVPGCPVPAPACL